MSTDISNGHNGAMEDGLIVVAQSTKKVRKSIPGKMIFKRQAAGQSSSPSDRTVVKGKLSMDKDVEKQLFHSPLPSYSPGAPPSAFSEEDETALQFFTCMDCGDRFLFESSLTQHVTRRSVKICLWRSGQSKPEEFYNRCSLLASLRQNAKSGIAGRVSVHPLDKEELTIPPCAVPVSTTDLIEASNSKQVFISSNSKMESEESSDPQLETNQENASYKLPVLSKPGKSADNASTQMEHQSHEKSSPQTIACEKSNTRKKSSLSSVVQMDQINKCPECNLKLPPKTNLQQHFAGALDTFIYSVKSKLKCNNCKIPFPSICSLKCHERIHLPQYKQRSSFVCPQCGVEFLDWDLFMDHLHTDCMHAYFSTSYKCKYCFSMFATSISLEVHILKVHVKKVYKCNVCNVACYSQQSLSKHRTETHDNFEGKPTVYQLCELCPGKLISSSVLLFHVHQHGEDASSIILRYVCEPCKVFAESVGVFKDHKKTCSHTQSKFTNPIATDTKEENKNEQFTTKKMLMKIPKLEQCAPNVQVKSEPVKKIVKKEKPKSPSKSNDIRPCHKCGSAMQQYKYRTYGCFNCNKKLMKKPKKASPGKKLQNGNQSAEMVEYSTCDNNNSKSSVKISCPVCCNLICDDYSSVNEHFLKCHEHIVIRANSYKEDLNSLKEKIMTERKESYRCLICEMWIKDEEEFREHIIAHRPEDNPGFQCLECGMCYVVKPSLEKHLLLAHKIKGVGEYLKESGQEQLDDKGHIVKENQCEVCYSEFESQQELNSHMRTHGLAFLKNIS